VVEAAAPDDPRVILGIGDDAAVVAPRSGKVVVTSDSLVEGTHFNWRLCEPRDVGFKAVAVNLSDLAAMGACPMALLLNYCLPADMEDGIVLGVTRGVAEACARYGATVVGGNVSRTQGPFEVTVTALGESRDGGFITRSGAMIGDVVMISGPVGSAALGLEALGAAPDMEKTYPGLARAYRRPVPRVDLGRLLTVTPGVHAAIDISDGLLSDLRHLLDLSGSGACVDVDLIPIAEEARRYCDAYGVNPVSAALSGGGDYELIVLIGSDDVEGMKVEGMTAVGEITDQEGRIDLSASGSCYPTPSSEGYRHR